MFWASWNQIHLSEVRIKIRSFSHHAKIIREISVADPGCLSRIPEPDFYPFRIPDPKTATKERGEKKSAVKLFFVAKNLTKLKII